ncbi:hypothetical protein M5G07_00300 [Serratia symbiotica]|nr:hypothetical protein [Serratia symbiotica]
MLKNGYLIRRLAFSGIIACSVALSLSAWATVPEFSAALSSISIEKSRSELLAALPRGTAVYYRSTLAPLYAANHMQLMWRDRAAIQQFQQQLAGLAMSGVQP